MPWSDPDKSAHSDHWIRPRRPWIINEIKKEGCSQVGTPANASIVTPAYIPKRHPASGQFIAAWRAVIIFHINALKFRMKEKLVKEVVACK